MVYVEVLINVKNGYNIESDRFGEALLHRSDWHLQYSGFDSIFN
jgi:hypothetical protein